MISFRFHVVSITAVFLAIAIGVVIGSTYVDDAVSGPLRNRINSVEGRVDQARAENADLEQELDATREYAELSAEYAVTNRLVDVPVMIAAVRGIDEEAVARTVVLARRAGATTPGIVWLEPRWALTNDEDVDALAEIVDAPASADPDELRATAWEAIAAELRAEETEAGGPGGPAATPVLGDLEASGFLTVDDVDDDSLALVDLAGTEPRLLLVTGTRAEEDIVPVVPVAAEASAAAGMVTVVGDVYVIAEDAPPRGAAVLDLFGEGARDGITIVDDLDLEPGRVAAVLALDSAADGEAGLHYGYGEGADAVLPGWTEP